MWRVIGLKEVLWYPCGITLTSALRCYILVCSVVNKQLDPCAIIHVCTCNRILLVWTQLRLILGALAVEMSSFH